ncbi:winged helix DNA-binding domain-containing protein [Lactococcus nasutitermitis]|uniref:Winged helix DNA-binding domain-containing protein n=1 Tax=Lactococcus nasutitermitis TaxID=1652957 RepID=A0ABV9JDI1_9LACT|nr:winged helix DNA-binding domain-containing protein [Lactococcus nasutitermitis]
MREKEILSERLNSHGLLMKKANVLDVLRQTIGIQAQAQREAELNLALRSQDLSLTELSKLYEEGKIVRSWANRWTLHLLTYEDWELLINARQNESLPNSYFLGEKELALAVITFLTDLLKVRKSLTKSEIEALISQDFPNFNLKSYLLQAVLQTMMQQGICYFDAGISSRAYRLVFAEHFQRTTAERAIELLIQRYMTGFAPAILEDFIKWSGLKISIVRPIWQKIIFDSSVKNIESTGGKTFIAARFDSLLTGYADKTWLTSQDKIPEMWSKNGILMAPIIFDNQLVGKWHYKISAKKITFTVEHWLPLNQSQIEEKLSDIAHFLEKKMQTIIYKQI